MMLLLHVLMLSLLSGGSAKVVGNFEQECGQFFANGKPPTRFYGPRFKEICQTLDDVVHYATYYDTLNKIPVYSAYKYEGTMGCKRLENKWYIEPQLGYYNGINMASEEASKKFYSDYFGSLQALNTDYEISEYDRGHLAPVYQARSQSCSDATFTLTNAAPQDPYFNRVLWWNVEKKLANDLKSKCRAQLVNFQHVYIVTGVVPGNTNINNRVNVPSHFWIAYCCLDQNNRCSRSGGVIGTNEDNSNIEIMTVTGLEGELQTRYGNVGIVVNLGKPFRIFQ